MTTSYTLIKGSRPLLISMPHNGQAIPDNIAAKMTETALKVPDTDWHKDRLYAFAEALGAWIIKPDYSRYVIDLNRAPDGENLYPGANSTELCPTTAFDLTPLYLDGQAPDTDEVHDRVNTFWQPYHQALQSCLAEIKAEHGIAILLEAHSILSHVPRFFDGQLPDFNFGTVDGQSCAPELTEVITAIDFSPYSTVVNGRFKGGYITRAYGEPCNNIHALQLELSQRTYMREPSNQVDQQLADQVIPKLQSLVTALLCFAERNKP